MDEIQATALARVSETDAVRGKFKQKIDEIKAIEEDTIGLHEDMEELKDTEMRGTPSKLGKENKVEDASKAGEKLCIENTIPETEKETPNVFTVIICWFGLACSAIVAVCK